MIEFRPASSKKRTAYVCPGCKRAHSIEIIEHHIGGANESMAVEHNQCKCGNGALIETFITFKSKVVSGLGSRENEVLEESKDYNNLF